jgi:glycosyltransferase involved in cell wall biosynthesis
VPVVITHACNMPEVTREKAGWEIEPETDALAACLRDLLSRSPAENRQTGRRGADLIRLEYSPARVSAQMEEVYAFVSDGIVPRTVELLVMGGRPAW